MGFFICWVVFALVLGVLAERKNRNVIGWALIGGLFTVPALLILAFLPPLCPKCHNRISVQDWRARRCPHCAQGHAQVEGASGALPAKEAPKSHILRWICAFVGIAVGLLGGAANVPQLGMAALFGPAIVLGLVGLVIGLVIEAVVRRVRTKENGRRPPGQEPS